MLAFIFELVFDLIFDVILWKNHKVGITFLVIVGLIVIFTLVWKP